ncbi:MAG: hypothetical protein PWQ57_1971 [Desulfovibrionales bacterium]|nr:hypothetical protein [Desulfovibrionales bacterium]
MIVHDKKHFILGSVMAVSFLIALSFMFTPHFGGVNAFHASDRLFNTIAKGSTYYMPALQEQIKAFPEDEIDVTLHRGNEKMAALQAILAAKAGFTAVPSPEGLKLQGKLNDLLTAAVRDSDDMFYNKGDEVSARYGMEPKQAMFVWWSLCKDLENSLKQRKDFKAAKLVHEVQARGVEVGYNFYGIEPESASSRIGALSFALVFYVVYTIWWGFALFFLSEGIGLQMKSGGKKEV